ncbi:MAG: hypothetical protein CVU09_11380 [Bacteroidetes bacterium HGW-Bacteroidetes-4]|jgi:DNA-binding MarR family transcriptional regulator|nr:MAG: hypothetical protein CVU09_11380 [Bacteroidetes bacterium HGW-Bacteroidetes-4]
MDYSFKKSLGHLSHELSKKLGSSFEKRMQVIQPSLKAEHWSVISLLHQESNLNQMSIAQVFGFDKVKVLRIINKLEKQHIVVRTIDISDKRAYRINLTVMGNEIYNQLAPLAATTIEDAFSSFSRDEREIFMKNLQKILKNLT